MTHHAKHASMEKALNEISKLSVVRAKPASAKGKYVRSATICSSMGPGVPLDVTGMNVRAV